MARQLGDINDPFYRTLFVTLHEKLNLRRDELEDGVEPDTKYREVVGYIRCLKDTLEWADNLYRDQYGIPPTEETET